MKLSLRIVVAKNDPSSFAHEGPTLRIGRDPACELFLEGDAAQGVSRQHARIDLDVEGAMLSDCGSSNGTLLNGEPISTPQVMHAGDVIQLGYLGPSLTLVDLSLESPPAAVISLFKSDFRLVFTSQKIGKPAAWVTGSLLLGLLLAFVIARWSRLREPLTPKSAPETETVTSGTNEDHAKAGIDLSLKGPPVTEAPPSAESSTIPEVFDDLPEQKQIGRVLAPVGGPPSLLLQRSREGSPWAFMQDDDVVLTTQMLVSLPGYRSKVRLDAGIVVESWGNLPEFCVWPPLLESAVIFHLPSPGADVELTLDRGRIRLGNPKSGPPTRIRVHLGREIIDLVLPPQGDVCLDFWNDPLRKDSIATTRNVVLVSKNPVEAVFEDTRLQLEPLTQLQWALGQKTWHPSRTRLASLPDWWIKPPDLKSEAIQDVLLSMLDWQKRLGSATDLLETILVETRTSADSTSRLLGLLFLGAIDEGGYLLEFLEDSPRSDRSHSRVSGTAMYALQVWLSRKSEHAAELARFIRRRGYSEQRIASFLQLLRYYSEEDLAQGDTYQILLAGLEDTFPPVRHLAFAQLAMLRPGLVQKTGYDPSAPPESRKNAVNLWRKELSAVDMSKSGRP